MMKKFGFISLALLAAVALSGCGKKQAVMEEGQEPMTMESLSTANMNAQAPVVI